MIQHHDMHLAGLDNSTEFLRDSRDSQASSGLFVREHVL